MGMACPLPVINAKKAIELGFADDTLKDEKAAADESAYAFAASAVEKALINRISEKAQRRKETKPTGRPVDELKMSLYKKLL